MKEVREVLAQIDGQYDLGRSVVESLLRILVRGRVFPARLKSPLESAPVNPLEWIVAGHAERNIQLGFHSEVYPGLKPQDAIEQYRNDFTVPEGAYKLAEKYRGRFDVAQAIDPRIELFRKHKLAGRIKELNLDNVTEQWTTSRVHEYIDTGKITDLTEHPTKIPYLVFTHDGQRYRYISVEEATERFADDEISSPQLEVTDLFLHHLEYFNGRGMFAAGSRSGHGSVSFLGTWRGGPGVSAGLVDYPGGDLGALSRGKDFVELGA